MTIKRTTILLSMILLCGIAARAQSDASRYVGCMDKHPEWAQDGKSFICEFIARGQFWEGMSPEQRAAAEASVKEIDAAKSRAAVAHRKKMASPAAAQIVQPAPTKTEAPAGTPYWLPLLVVLAFVLYFAPTLVAQSRHHHQTGAIGVLNFFLGWTILGWIIAAVWASTATPEAAPKVTAEP